MRKVLFLPVSPVVPHAVLRAVGVVFFLAVWVHDFLEVLRFKVGPVVSTRLARSPLFFFQTVLFFSCEIPLALFKSPQIGPKSRVGAGQVLLHFFCDVVQVHCKLSKEVVPVVLLRERIALPQEAFSATNFAIDLVAPGTDESSALVFAALVCEDSAIHLMTTRISPTCGLKLDGANHVGFAVLDCHCAHVLNVHITKEEVVHCGRGPANQVVLVECLKMHMLEPDGDSFESARPGDAHLGVRVHMVFVVLTLRNTGRDRRMVANLLGKVLVVWPDKLVCLAKNRIKRLVCSVFRAFVLRDSKRCDKHDSSDWVLALVRFVQKILVFHDLRYFLNHGHRLVKVNRDAETRQVFAHRIFQNLPDGWLVVGVLLEWQTSAQRILLMLIIGLILQGVFGTGCVNLNHFLVSGNTAVLHRLLVLLRADHNLNFLHGCRRLHGAS